MPAQAIEGLLGHPPEVFKATFEGAERLAAESGDEYATNGVVMLKPALPKIESAITVAKNYIPRVLEEIAPVHRRYPFALTRLPTDTRLLGGLDQLRSLMTGLNLMTRLKSPGTLGIATGVIAASAAVGALGGSTPAKAEPVRDLGVTASNPQAAERASQLWSTSEQAHVLANQRITTA